MACEKCWADAYFRWQRNPEKTQAEHYGDLLDERKDYPCTAEEQLGLKEGWNDYGRQMSNGRVCANSNCYHTEDQHVSDMCWGKTKEIRKDGPTPGCRCNGFVARRDTARIQDIIGTTNILKVPKAQRWRFVSDDDGHYYLIPADKEQEFNEWVERVSDSHLDTEAYDKYVNDFQTFDQYRTSMSPNNYTFTDPKEDK